MGKVSISPTPVLRGLNNTNNSPKSSDSGSCDTSPMFLVGGQQSNNPEVIHIRKQLTRLCAGCSQLDSIAIRRYLEAPSTHDYDMLSAWSRCGRNDRGRTVRLDITAQARGTVTPFGIACLLAYARAWIDEAEALALADGTPGSSSAPREDAPPTRPRQGPTRAPRARSSGKSKS